MQQFNCTWLACLAVLIGVSSAPAQPPAPPPAAQPLDAPQAFTVFLRSTPVGREEVAVVRQADGWLIRGSNTLAPPLDVVTRRAEIHYTPEWQPTRMTIEGTTRGQSLSITTTFASGSATSEIEIGGKANSKTDQVAADTVVLPNGFLGSYAALARRLVGQKPGATFRAYIAPQVEIPMRLDAIYNERIETPRAAISATRHALIVTNPPPAADMLANVWTDAAGNLLRMSVPAQGLELAREDVASPASRTTAFSIPGDEAIRVPSLGFGLAGTATKPANATGRLPAVILVGGSGPIDRDGFVAGIPVLGQIARDLVNAGFLVVRYDKRGVGQSGGRLETATIGDYAEDVRAIVKWLKDERKDVDDDRIGVVGHSEGAWVAMAAAARDGDIAAVTLIAGASTKGGDLVLEQQRHALERIKAPEDERTAKVELQIQIQNAVLTGKGWDGVPDDLRRTASTPWFASFLAFDPERVMRDVRQPVLIVQGELDTQVRPHHADRLHQLAAERKRKVAADIVRVPGANHLLVAAKTGEVDEYYLLSAQEVVPAATSAIASWMLKHLGEPGR